jgi:hypothetical protein
MRRILVFILICSLFLSLIPIIEPGVQSAPPFYDYLVSSDIVKDREGTTVYEAGNMSGALNWALAHSNTTTYVPAGNFTLRDRVTGFANGVTLMGDGTNNTIFNFVWGHSGRSDDEYGGGKWFFGFQSSDVSNVTLKQFSITGDGCILFNTSKCSTFNNLVQDVTIKNTTNIQITSFGSWVSSGLVADGYRFIRCIADHTGGDGFDIWGRGDSVNSGMHRNVHFEDCKAVWCGYIVRYWDWTPGWDIGEGGLVENVELVRCEASNNWESGFHFEANRTSVTGASLIDCIADHNGQKYSDPRGAAYGYGCHENIGPTFVNFSATGNPGGARGWMQLYDYTTNFCTYRVGNYAGPMNIVYYPNDTTAFKGDNFTQALQWAAGQTNSIVDIPRCNETSLYTVAPFIATGSISLAHGVRIYGNSQEGQWPSAFSAITFLNRTDGFIQDSSNEIINIVMSDPLPSQVQNLVAEPGNGNVTLSWDTPAYSNASAIKGYFISYGKNESSMEMRILWDEPVFVHSGLSKGLNYYYTVAALNDAGLGLNSTIISATPFGVPSEPTGLTAKAGDGYVELNWSGPSYSGPGPTSYHLFRNGTLIWSGYTLALNDSSIKNGAIYGYSVSTKNQVGWGLNSSQVIAHPREPLIPPGVPIGLHASIGDGHVVLTWTAPNYSGSSPINGYKVYRRSSTGSITFNTTSAFENYSDSNLTNGQTYYYRISAVSSAGESDLTEEVDAIPIAPTSGDNGMDIFLVIIVIIVISLSLLLTYSIMHKPKDKS